jgi:hypothetical protein
MATQPTKLPDPDDRSSSPLTTAAQSSSPPTTLTDLPEELLPPALKDNEIDIAAEELQTYVAISLTTKQFRRIVLPLVKVEHPSDFYTYTNLTPLNRSESRAWCVKEQIKGWVLHRYWWIGGEVERSK